MIKIKNVCAGYQGKEVLHNINLEFEAEKVTVIIGPNGCGKSTLLKTLVRLNEKSSGEILVATGKQTETCMQDDSQMEYMEISKFDSAKLAQHMAYLPQNKRTPDISVLRMVLHGRFAYLKYPRRYGKKDYEIAKKALKWMGIEDLADKNVAELSGGTQQKVYIAMALAQDTPVILLDEPTTYLDISHQLKTMELAKKLAREGKAVVMVLHDLGHAFQVADKVVVMSEGEIRACGIPDEIYRSNIVDEVFDVHLEKAEINGQKIYVIV